MTTPPEYETLEAFVEYLRDDERDSVTHNELQLLNFHLNRPVKKLRIALVEAGFALAERPSERQIRGFRANSHNRWQSFPSHGGSGWNQINGFAGQNG